ncbi:thiamine pyrophosphate-dependent acetolactate synthase large subunit-like protein [Saccharothrix tamanrassetensis]|uniref:Thiamine pyrophosphate-dependent acetolactate synthase large subunit-like protein n=1 Tax=Saccharothrix tamanrassetensis TaxID=1051531 RepID=A0A841CUX1_9PSEU|nr:thiamine pyrophosphate-binding protein [Saccharothrix tamanrassetensis]MBB5959745.1 thiamine pyrophosphate-dependent acetolactate synthase large subunit-like protein [Saccharothrix tamanrassetensis]
MTVADAVGRALAELGADHVFGVVGSGNFHVTNALIAGGARYVAARHEGGAATMADAYARTSGKLGVLSVHQGCGLTNAMTGIAEAAKSRTPMVVLAAEVTSPRSNFFVDQTALATSVGAVAERVTSASSAVDTVVRAVRRATHERRTVVLNLPLDLQAEPAPVGSVEPVPPYSPPAPDPSAVEALAAAITKARRPVFVAGRGARHARAELERLAERCGALLATSAVANGLFAGNPWSLGISGGFANPLAVELISGADLVVGWGCALNTWTTRHGTLIGSAAGVAQVDLDADALGAHRPVDLGVVGDVRAVAAALRVGAAPGYRSPGLASRIARSGRWRDVPFTDESEVDRIDPRALSTRLDDLLPAERVIGVDSGNFMGYPSAYLSVPDERGFCFTQAFQSIGLGLATAIGAALARPDRLPVAALGDGGGLMGIAELETVVRLGLPMVVVVYNDSGYGAEIHHFGPAGHSLDTVRFADTDLAAIGRGFGCTALTVRRRDDLVGVTRWLDGPRDTPLLIDAKVTTRRASWWLEEAFRGH